MRGRGGGAVGQAALALAPLPFQPQQRAWSRDSVGSVADKAVAVTLCCSVSVVSVLPASSVSCQLREPLKGECVDPLRLLSQNLG